MLTDNEREVVAVRAERWPPGNAKHWMIHPNIWSIDEVVERLQRNIEAAEAG